MLFKWISKIIDSIYRSIQEENIQWDDRVHKLNKEILLAIERYNQMEKQFDDAKFFMQCIMYKKLLDKQKKDFKHSSIMCSISEWQDEKSTQTMKDKKMIFYNESQLIDDLISEFIKVDRTFLSTDFFVQLNLNNFI
jgi:hypothetical protein